MSTTSLAPVASQVATAPQALSKPRARPYRDYLTPSLHRRFIRAATVGFVASYGIAVVLSRPPFLWIWFPFSLTGIRAGLIFMSVLMVFIIRIANLRVARRTFGSPISSIMLDCVSVNTYRTLAWYLGSAFIFVEVLIWSAPESLRLKVVDPGTPYERPFLNERPIYLRSVFLLLAVRQTACHVWFELDCVGVSGSWTAVKMNERPFTFTQGFARIRTKMGPIVQHALSSIIIMTPVAPLAYTLFLRKLAWEWTYAFQKNIVELPKFQKMSRFPPFFGDLFITFWFWGWILIALWSISNLAFDSYISDPPLNKKTEPLSSDSKDPNGTLLTGLRARKEFVFTSAFAELLILAREDPRRRESIFKELDRSGGSTWAQLVALCLGQLHGISKRINDFRNPPIPKPPMPEQLPGDVNHLPKMAPPIRHDNIITSSPVPKSHIVSDIDSFAKSRGSSTSSRDSLISRSRAILNSFINVLFDEEQQKTVSESRIAKLFWQYVRQFLTLPYVGPLFRVTFARRANAIVLGEAARDGTNVYVIHNATAGLTALAVHSAREDQLGRASRDVATILRTYVGTIATLEDFKAWLEPHWTDVEFRNKDVKNVDDILCMLKDGLRTVLQTFDEYSELGLTIKEKRVAREKAGMDGSAGQEIGHGTAKAPETRERRRPHDTGS